MQEYNILIGGQAGQGSRKAGLVIAKILNQLGYKIYIYDDYQSLIRGGHSFSKIRASKKDVSCDGEGIDILLCLNKETLDLHKKELNENALVLFNEDKLSFKNGIGVKIETIAKEAGGSSIMANTALLGAFAKVVGIEFEFLKEILKKEFNKHSVINLKIAKKAYDSVDGKIKIKPLKGKVMPLLTGNEALSLGAVQAGLESYFAYPMTPATGVLHFLANNNLGVRTIQLENEISVIISAIGAAYSGEKSMVGTSGGGFALMTEGISLAAMAETPVVVVESQRAGPASGVPTYSAQADLSFVLNAGHGDIVKFTVAPGDVNEAYFWGGELLNLAWKYQTPAVLLVDKNLSEGTSNLDTSIKVKEGKTNLWNKKGEYLRYKNTGSGVSPLAFPGSKAIVKATSYEHDEYGLTIEDSEKEIKKMQDKRLKKFESMKAEVLKMKNAINVFGNKKSDTVLFTFGSTKGVVKEVAEELGVKMIQIVMLEPFPIEQVLKEVKGAKRIFTVEENALGQLAKLLALNGIDVDETILKYTSRPILKNELKKIL
jgi:2-oxoglutarate ferredoxin oxidoreductase subunit alpha